jgi:hypothetical protein
MRNVPHVSRHPIGGGYMYALGWEVGRLRDQNRELDERDEDEGREEEISMSCRLPSSFAPAVAFR